MSRQRRKKDDSRQKAMAQFWDAIAECGGPKLAPRRITYRKPTPAQPKVCQPRKITKAREEGSLEKSEEV